MHSIAREQRGTLATTLRDNEVYPLEALAELHGVRSRVEQNLRHLKQPISPVSWQRLPTGSEVGNQESGDQRRLQRAYTIAAVYGTGITLKRTESRQCVGVQIEMST
jgi:hypothetical protein